MPPQFPVEVHQRALEVAEAEDVVAPLATGELFGGLDRHVSGDWRVRAEAGDGLPQRYPAAGTNGVQFLLFDLADLFV